MKLTTVTTALVTLSIFQQTGLVMGQTAAKPSPVSGVLYLLSNLLNTSVLVVQNGLQSGSQLAGSVLSSAAEAEKQVQSAKVASFQAALQTAFSALNRSLGLVSSQAKVGPVFQIAASTATNMSQAAISTLQAVGGVKYNLLSSLGGAVQQGASAINSALQAGAASAQSALSTGANSLASTVQGPNAATPSPAISTMTVSPMSTATEAAAMQTQMDATTPAAPAPTTMPMPMASDATTMPSEVTMSTIQQSATELPTTTPTAMGGATGNTTKAK